MYMSKNGKDSTHTNKLVTFRNKPKNKYVHPYDTCKKKNPSQTKYLKEDIPNCKRYEITFSSRYFLQNGIWIFFFAVLFSGALEWSCVQSP